MKNLCLIISLFGIVLYSCQAPESEPDLDQLRIELQQMEDSFANAINAKDAEAVMPYFAEDANRLPSNKPTVTGKAAIRERLIQNLADDSTGITSRFEVVDVFADGN